MRSRTALGWLAQLRERIGVEASTEWGLGLVAPSMNVIERKLSIAVTDREVPGQWGEALALVWARSLHVRAQQCAYALMDLGLDGEWTIGVVWEGRAIAVCHATLGGPVFQTVAAPEPQSLTRQEQGRQFARVRALLSSGRSAQAGGA